MKPINQDIKEKVEKILGITVLDVWDNQYPGQDYQAVVDQVVELVSQVKENTIEPFYEMFKKHPEWLEELQDEEVRSWIESKHK